MSDFNASEFTCIQIFRELVICFYEIREQSFGKTPLVYIILSFQTETKKNKEKKTIKTVREKYFCEKKNKLLISLPYYRKWEALPLYVVLCLCAWTMANEASLIQMTQLL